MKRFLKTVVMLIAILAGPNAAAASPDPLFQDHAALRVEITAPFSRIIRERPKDQQSPGLFSYRAPDGTKVDLDVQLRARGRYRHANCDFPPLRLNFRRSQVKDTLFEQQNKLKMVVHCKDSLRYAQSVLREYLAYRLLNVLTDRSFQVRLLEVTYIDTDERRPRMVRSAFVIEHEDRLAERLGMNELNVFPDSAEDLQGDHLNLTSVFQYLLGNTDFSPILGSNNECCHNYVLFGKEGRPQLAIPYDFDMSGFVYAPYARPDEELGIDNVRQRLYQGFCVNNRHVADSVARFSQARETLYALIADQQELEPTVRESIAEYLDEFYEVLSDPRAVEREITGRCL